MKKNNKEERINLPDFLISVAIGDISGVPYEFNPNKNPEEINLLREDNDYSDDTVCTFALAKALLENLEIEDTLRELCLSEKGRGYGGRFLSWILDPTMGPYESWGNGSAMRVSSAAVIAESKSEVRSLSNKMSKITHNHPEGMKGARATASIIWDLLHGASKHRIALNLGRYYPKWKGRDWKWLQENYVFRVSCQETVPAAILCFLESTSFEDCIIKCCSSGGDSDTLGAIAAPMAYAYYREMPEELVKHAKERLPEWMLEVNEAMNQVK